MTKVSKGTVLLVSKRTVPFDTFDTLAEGN